MFIRDVVITRILKLIPIYFVFIYIIIKQNNIVKIKKLLNHQLYQTVIHSLLEQYWRNRTLYNYLQRF